MESLDTAMKLVHLLPNVWKLSLDCLSLKSPAEVGIRPLSQTLGLFLRGETRKMYVRMYWFPK